MEKSFLEQVFLLSTVLHTYLGLALQYIAERNMGSRSKNSCLQYFNSPTGCLILEYWGDPFPSPI